MLRQLLAAEQATPHSPGYSFITEALILGAALQDVQDALGHADPRTACRHDRSRHNLTRALTIDDQEVLPARRAGDPPIFVYGMYLRPC